MRDFLRHWTLLCLPLLPPTIHDPHILVPIHREQPERIARVPVVLIAVQDNGGIIVDAPAAHELLEALLVHEIARYRVLHIDMPVELDCTWQVTNFIQQYIFIYLDQANIGVVEMFGNPTCLYQHLRMYVTRHGSLAGCGGISSSHL